MLIRIVKDWAGRSNKMERLWLMAKIEFKLRYYENKLGLLWALIKPVSDIFIYYVAFELILKQGVPNFVSFLFIGLILWNFFVESTTGTVQILSTKKYLYEYTNMNKIEIYLSTLFSNCIGFGFNFFMFTLFYNFFDAGSHGFSVKPSGHFSCIFTDTIEYLCYCKRYNPDMDSGNRPGILALPDPIQARNIQRRIAGS